MTHGHPASAMSRLAQMAREMEAAGQPYVIATVVRRRPPVSAQVGDKALITADGRMFGWIGGSCSQSVVLREALAALQEGRPRLVRLSREATAGATEAGVTTVPMTCPSGGEVEVYVEPHITRPRLVAVGNTPLVQALGILAPVVGLDVTLVAEREEDLELPVDWARRMTLAEFREAAFPGLTFFVIASAGLYDEEALACALRTSSPYVALVASRRRAAAVREVLLGIGYSEEDLRRIRTPAGLDIGARTQEEIALSILAEVVACYRRDLATRAAVDGAAAEGGNAGLAARPAAATDAPAAVTAVDPVCGMAVEVATARYTTAYQGTTYYFCCPHCRHTFMKEPEKYLGVAGAPAGVEGGVAP